MDSEPEPSDDEIAAAKPTKATKARKAKADSYLPDIHRLLPKSEDAEQGVICSFLLDPLAVGDRCVERRITHSMFHIPAHASIYSCLIGMHLEREPIDLVTLTQKLRDWKELDQCGGAAFITQLFTFLPTAANCDYYLEILEEKFTLREIIRVCTEYAGRAYDEQAEVTMLLDQVETKILGISKARQVQPDSGCTAQELAMIGIHEIERRIALNGAISGLSTGFDDLDLKTDGLHSQEFIAIAGKSGSGKSALAMQIIEHLTIEQKIPCAVFPLEMGRKQLAQRMIFTRARVNTVRWRGPNGRGPSESDNARMVQASAEIAKSPLYVQDASDCTIQGVRAQMRRLVAKHGVRVCLIDSLSALHSDSRQARDNRIREAAECSEGCKEMAKELGITVLLICHIGKDKKRDERPSPADLRESGKVELDADSLWFLYEPDFDEKNPTSEPEIELWIPKQRDGEPFVASKLIFRKYHTRFHEPTPTNEPDQQQLI